MPKKPLQYIQVDPQDIAYIIGVLETQHEVGHALKAELYKHAIALELKKGQHLLYQGDTCNYMYFIREGALMAYSMYKEKKITTYISVENEFVSSLSGLYGEQPSREAIVAVEPTLVLGVHTDILQEWYNRFFDLNYIIRKVYESYYRDAQERTHVIRVGNAAERYHYFVKSKPGYVERLPLDVVASFLDMKPETLSRIMKEDKGDTQSKNGDQLFEQLKQFIQETKCFKEKTVKIQSIATRFGIPAYKLSQVLNKAANLNFNDFINQYRITYLKDQLKKEGILQSYTIEALALEAGFASRSGFYKAFKKIEGISPKEFLASTKVAI